MYIDPGTGSLVLQAVAATVLSVGLTFRRGRDAVKHLFHSLLGRFRH